MRRMSIVLLLPCLLALSSRFSFAADNDKSASRYFGRIEAPCAAEDTCRQLTALVMCATEGKYCAANQNKCDTIDEACIAGQRITEILYGNTHRQNFPDFIVYLDDSREDGVYFNASGTPGKTFKLTYHQPLLMWDGKNTPHLMGTRYIHILALTHHKLNIRARLTSERQYEPNPFRAIGSALEITAVEASEAKPAESKEADEFVWSPLNGDANSDVTGKMDDRKMLKWLATTKIEVPENSINRITVSYGPVLTTGKASGESKKVTTDNDEEDADITAAGATGKSGKDEYKGDFVGATGHFSNSPDSNTAVSLVLGATFNTKNTNAAGSTGSDIVFNGFVCAKFYPDRYRPYLYAAPEERRYHRSLGVVLGTSVKDTFKNIIVGLSSGHWIGNVGFVAGFNSIEGTGQGRKQRAFFGVEYTL